MSSTKRREKRRLQWFLKFLPVVRLDSLILSWTSLESSDIPKILIKYCVQRINSRLNEYIHPAALTTSQSFHYDFPLSQSGRHISLHMCHCSAHLQPFLTLFLFQQQLLPSFIHHYSMCHVAYMISGVSICVIVRLPLVIWGQALYVPLLIIK